MGEAVRNKSPDDPATTASTTAFHRVPRADSYNKTLASPDDSVSSPFASGTMRAIGSPSPRALPAS